MVTLGPHTYTLRPSFAALLQLEQRTGCGLVTLARRFADGSFTLADAEAVLRAGIEGAGQSAPAELGLLLVQSGLAGVAQPLAAFLHLALTGEESGAGKA